MAVPTVVRSTDSGFSPVSGEDGALHEQLKTALPLLGWTLVDSNDTTKQALYRNSTVNGGSGRYLWFGDLSADHDGDARRCAVRGYDSAVSLTDMTNQIGPDPGYIIKSYTLNSAERPWLLVGDDKSFWLSIKGGRANGDVDRGHHYYFGETAPLTADTGAFIVTASSQLGVANTVQVHWAATTTPEGSSTGGMDGVFAATDVAGTVINSRQGVANLGLIAGSTNLARLGAIGAATLRGRILTDVYWIIPSSEAGWLPRSILRGTAGYRCNRMNEHTAWSEVTLNTAAGPSRTCLHMRGSSSFAWTTGNYCFAVDLGNWDDWHDKF